MGLAAWPLAPRAEHGRGRRQTQRAASCAQCVHYRGARMRARRNLLCADDRRCAIERRLSLSEESGAERERRKRPRDRPTDKQLAMQLAPGLARAYRRSAVLCRPYTKIIQRCTTHPAAAPPPAPPGPGGRATTHTRTFRARAVRPSHSRRAALQLHMHVLQCAHPHDARKAQHHWRSAWGAAGGVGGF